MKDLNRIKVAIASWNSKPIGWTMQMLHNSTCTLSIIANTICNPTTIHL